MRPTSARVTSAILVAGLLVAACGGGDDDKSDDGGDTTEADAGSTDSETADVDSDGGDADDGAAASGATVDLSSVLDVDLNNCAEAPSGEPIKVGMAMDFSELVGFVDIPGSKLVPYTASLFNCAGGINGQPVEVQVEDVGGSAEGAGVAAESLLDWGAQVMVGPPFADFALPILQATEGQVPLFVAASTEPTLGNAEQNSYLVTFDDTGMSTAAANWALSEGKTKAFVFTQPGPYTGYNPDVFSEVFTEGGGEIVSELTYEWGVDTDFSTQVAELSGILEGDEVFFSAGYANQVTALRGQLEGAGFNDITYIGTDAISATTEEDTAALEGVVHTPHNVIEDGDQLDTLLKRYAEDEGEELGQPLFMGLYVDSLLLGLQAISDCGCSDPVEIGSAVREIENYPGTTGSITYKGTNGIPPKAVPVVKIEGGQDVLLVKE